MADSVRERIYQNIVLSLKAINGVAPFKLNLLNRVFRYGSPGFDEPAFPMVQVYDPLVTYKWLNAGDQMVNAEMVFTIWAKVEGVANSESPSRSTSKILSDLEHDILYAILQDPGRGKTGSWITSQFAWSDPEGSQAWESVPIFHNARETHIDESEATVFSGADPIGEIMFRIRIVFAFLAADPTVAR